MKKLRIVSVASEVAPFSKTGGLADVARSLPKSLKRLGHTVTVITPFYKRIIDAKLHHLEPVLDEIELSLPREFSIPIRYFHGELMRGLPIYFVSCDKYFGRKKTLYGSDDENKRFYVFNAAALKLIEALKLQPDIIHCHDWHTGLVPELLKKQYRDNDQLKGAATVFTIHNLTFQLGHDWWAIDGHRRDHGTSPLPDIHSQRHLERINFAKRAILYADVINAVSETYAEEILEPRFGQDLHRILQNRRHKLFGVVNGIDYREFNPARDSRLRVQYDYRHLLRKHVNKKVLQRLHGLIRNERMFMIIMASRIAEQKGFDILLPAVPAILGLPHTQLVIMGDGDREYIKCINKLVRKYPGRIALVPFDEQQETLLYAGGDISLFPSRFEPCGIGQLKSLRYGCIPVVHEIGGLGDTIEDVDASPENGNGFTFREYDAMSMLAALTRAYTHSKHHTMWRALVVRGMKQSNSWELPARKYVELYKKALRFKHEDDHVG